MDEQRDKTASDGTAEGAPCEPMDASVASAAYLACEAGGFTPAADRIADGVSTVAGLLTAERKKARWRTCWDHTKSIGLLITIVIGALFTLEQFLASKYETEKGRAETLLSSASDALGSTDRVLQANSVRTLPKIGGFTTYTVPTGARGVFRHVPALFALPTEYPYFEQSWLLFRDVATSHRGLTDHIVSSALLREGAAWESRIRRGRGVPIGWVGGSLLFQAQLPGATANNVDLKGIQFGASDLRGADISGSDCTDCGLLGAKMDGINLRGSTLDSAFLAEASMDGADFSFARLTRAVLSKAQVADATFLQTDLTSADFTGARLDDSTFSQATIRDTDFTNASLKEVRFLQTDVGSAIFENADVQGADFTGAVGFTPDVLSTARNIGMARLPSPVNQGR